MSVPFCSDVITVDGREQGSSMNTNVARELGPIGIDWIDRRGLDPEVAVRYGLYTGKMVAGGAIEPDRSGNVIVFPYSEHGTVVTEKYRALPKKFWQRPGGRRTFWNSDVLDDPALQRGDHPLIIVEGEPDALAAICCGFPFVVSVPDGAPPMRGPEHLATMDPAEERSGKFEFLWNNRERLKRIKRFVLAVDGDAPGQRLSAELVRRLSAARCSFVAAFVRAASLVSL
jgi:twinkle protein